MKSDTTPGKVEVIEIPEGSPQPKAGPGGSGRVIQETKMTDPYNQTIWCGELTKEQVGETLNKSRTTPNPVDLEIAYRNALYIRDNVLHQTAQARAAESVAALARFEPKLEYRYGR